MKEIFVTKKEFIIREVDNSVRTFLTWKGYPVYSKQQLVSALIFNAEQTIKDKYLKDEVTRQLEEFKLCKLNKKDVKRLLKYIKFK
jgi:hypothetical protein